LEIEMTDASQQLRTVRQLAEDLKPTGSFTEASIRWLVFNSARNGFDSCIVRVGRKVFIDRLRFNAWLEAQRQPRAA
jgi:hypothetical protein